MIELRLSIKILAKCRLKRYEVNLIKRYFVHLFSHSCKKIVTH